MSLKMELVERWRAGEKIAALCREYGISRTTAHKWTKRFEAAGYDGLEEQSRRPKTAPQATAEDVVMTVLRVREAHPRWGPRKLHPLIRRKLGAQAPSPRTIARILKRADKLRSRVRKVPVHVVAEAPKFVPRAANELWTVDFKGWWRARNGDRCEPLTVRDAFSRYVLAVVICDATTEAVRQVFEGLFRRYGVPGTMQCDNGTPFISVRSRGGISSLSAWWLSLGIRLVRSRPGCPQDNGGHERMHVDIAGDVQIAPGADVHAEQRRLARWRQEFNQVRAHDALGGKTPAEVYKVAELRRPKPVPFAYPTKLHVRRVARSGHAFFRNDEPFIGTAFAGYDVGIEVVDDMHVRAWFRDIDLGVIEVVPDVSPSCFDAARAMKPTPRRRMQERRANAGPGGA